MIALILVRKKTFYITQYAHC